MPDLLIVGAGGFARETAQLVRALPGRRLAGFLEDGTSRRGTLVDGVPVLGPPEDATRSDADVVVCTGSPRDYASRARIVARLALPASRYATLVHPTAWTAESCALGPGTVVLAGTVLTASVTVGAHVAVMPHTTLTHDDVIEDFATIASGVRLGGSVRVGAGAYVGAGALVREGVTVGAGALVGMGAVVLEDVPPGEVWAGNPARRLRSPGGSG
ncbi:MULTISPECIES: NeuD/PglB/VioB family sugar acetyltransferase [Actinomadura]|uniref:NeuD/PglB/VioB family sugar acetyltransferase n=1 Tax=Actinomadura yumaensis TaxID=111807 RepID=A0ABW2C9S8_9ACTN|nr:NeuD/PglB/VioB family sugar acetyltransferase [Actinomadura sp. J1-007]MWK33725.1 acetyltransferase [Actinomadura sp. J1-007]